MNEFTVATLAAAPTLAESKFSNAGADLVEFGTIKGKALDKALHAIGFGADEAIIATATNNRVLQARSAAKQANENETRIGMLAGGGRFADALANVSAISGRSQVFASNSLDSWVGLRALLLRDSVPTRIVKTTTKAHTAGDVIPTAGAAKAIAALAMWERINVVAVATRAAIEAKAKAKADAKALADAAPADAETLALAMSESAE